MGFLDKAKVAATQAMQQGQAKVGAIQQSRTEGELYRTLGEAVYREQRQGGAHESVEAALVALDTHFAQVAQAAAAAQAAATTGATGTTGPTGSVPDQPNPAAPAAPTAASPQAAPPSGNFTLDDL